MTTKSIVTAGSIALVAAFSLVSAGSPAHADGIRLLTTVSTIKADDANDEAMAGADKQRELVKKQQTLRAQQRHFEKSVGPVPCKPPTCTHGAEMAAGKKKKKGGGNTQQYMEIKLQDALISSYRPSLGGGPKGGLGGGLLDNSGGGFNQNAASSMGSPAPAANVIK